MSFFTWSADKNGGSLARFKTSSSCSILFPIYLKLRILYKHLLSNLFFINILRFLGQIFLVRKRWVHETVSSTRITGAGTNPSLKKIGKTPSSHIIHSPEGEHCWRVREQTNQIVWITKITEWLHSNVPCLMSDVRRSKSYVWCPMFTVRCMMSDVWCPMSDLDVRCAVSNVRTKNKTKNRTKIKTRNRKKNGQKKGQEIDKNSDEKSDKRSYKK